MMDNNNEIVLHHHHHHHPTNTTGDLAARSSNASDDDLVHDHDEDDDYQTVISGITFDNNSLFAGPLYPPTSDLNNLNEDDDEEEDVEEESSLVELEEEQQQQKKEEEPAVATTTTKTLLEGDHRYHQHHHEQSDLPPPPSPGVDGRREDDDDENNKILPSLKSAASAIILEKTTTTTGAVVANTTTPKSSLLDDQVKTVAAAAAEEDSNKLPKKGSIVDHHHHGGGEKEGVTTKIESEKEEAKNKDLQPLPKKEEEEEILRRSKDADAAFHQGEEDTTTAIPNHQIQPLPLTLTRSSQNNRMTIASIPGAHAVMTTRSGAATTTSRSRNGITTSCQQQQANNNNTHTQGGRGLEESATSNLFESTNYSASLVVDEELEEGLRVEQEGDAVEVFEGVAEQEKQRDNDKSRKRRLMGWIILGVLFLFALLAVLVPLLVQGNNTTTGRSSSNHEEPNKDPPNSNGQTSTEYPQDNNKNNDTSSFNEEEATTTEELNLLGSTDAGVHKIYPPFLEEGLEAEVVAAIEKGEADDPFYKANKWMMNDPNFHLYSPARQKQRYYLVMMFFATNGETWINNQNWLNYNVSECLWYSSSSFPTDSRYYPTQVCNENNTMISLSLAHNNLTGIWPIYYTSFLPDLQIFDIGYNNIGGPFPKVTTASAIEALVFSQNPLTGAPVVSLYGGVGPFDNLKVLTLDDTKIRGRNGGGLFYLTPKLEVLNSTGQTYNAPIYSTLGLLTNLEYLNYGHTEAFGMIPTELGLLHNLTFLDLSSLPGLNGTLPSQLGQLTKLTHLDLTETPLTGIIPRGLCNSTVQQRTLTIMANCDEIDCCT